MLIAQISDIHAEDDSSSLLALFHALDYLRPLQPEALLVSGDIANKPWTQGYMLARSILKTAEYPVYMLPGNADGREAMRAAWADFRYWPKFGPMNFSVTIDEMRLVALDVTVPGEKFGRAGPQDLNWLREQVSTESPLPVIVMTHQHLFETRIAGLDDNMCLNGAEVLAVLAEAKDPIAAITCGHGHRAIFTHVGGLNAMMCPSLCPANPAALDGREEPSAPDAPALLLHHFDRGHLTTHLVSLA